MSLELLFPTLVTIICLVLGFWYQTVQFNDTVRKEINQLKLSYSLSLAQYYTDKRIDKYQKGLSLLNILSKASFTYNGYGYIDLEIPKFMKDFEKWYITQANSITSKECDSEINFMIVDYEIDLHDSTSEEEIFEKISERGKRIYQLLKSDITLPLDVIEERKKLI